MGPEKAEKQPEMRVWVYTVLQHKDSTSAQPQAAGMSDTTHLTEISKFQKKNKKQKTAALVSREDPKIDLQNDGPEFAAAHITLSP